MDDFKSFSELEFVLFLILTVSTAIYCARSQFCNHFRELVGQVYLSSLSTLSMLISLPFLSHIYLFSSTSCVALVGTGPQWHCNVSHDLCLDRPPLNSAPSSSSACHRPPAFSHCHPAWCYPAIISKHR